MFKYEELPTYAKVLFIIYLQAGSFLLYPIVTFIILILPTYHMRVRAEIDKRINAKLKVTVENGEIEEKLTNAVNASELKGIDPKKLPRTVILDILKETWQAEITEEVRADKSFIDSCWKGSIRTCLKISGYILAFEIAIMILMLPRLLITP